jgi:filamentous hemagglutinin family protein
MPNPRSDRRFASAHRAVAASPAVSGHRPVALVISLAACFSSPGVWAQATGMQAVHGAATVSTQGNLTTITTQNGAGSAHSALNWQSFGVAAGSTTQFLQPSATSTSINRVLGNNPSAIFGNLSSNGRLVLVNPSGIAVGAGAVVDTAGFTASTLGMTQSDAVAGRLRFGSAGAVGAAAGLSVDGRILARSGDIVLIAPHVQAGAAALIESPNGATVLAAGQKLELTGRGLEGIHLELQAPDNQAINLGHLSGDAVGVFAGTLKHSGQISAQAVSVQGGKVVLQAAGDTLVSGSIKASALDAKGGNIDVLGQRVALQAGASLDASGAAGGGNVRVGGDFQGRNPDVVNATQTHFDRDATIRADATESGQGGRVIVWADDQTRGDGTISARGGALGGDGGFVEVSGKHRLAFNATVDTRAPLGKTGTLMLDPDDITITSGPVDSYTAPVMFADAPATLDLDVSTIDSATSNVVLQANNDININASVNIGLAGIGFSAEAGGYVNVNQSITTNGGAVSLTAGAAGAAPAPSEGALYVNGAINTNGGNISLHSNLSDVGGNATYIAAPLNAGTGAVNISGQRVDVVGTAALIEGQTININTTAANGNISIEGVTLNSVNGLWIAATGAESDVTVSDSTLTVSGAGDLQLIAEQGSVDATSVMASASSGDILISGGATSAAQYGSGVYLSGGSFIASGAVTIDGSTIQSYANGVEISDDITLSSSAGTSILGLSLAPSDAGNGVRISIGDGFVGLTGSGALIAIGQTNGNYSGVSVYDTINRTGGDIVLQGSAVGSGGNAVDISYSDIYSNGSDVIIEGTGGNGASVSIGGSFIDSGGGNVDVTGGHAGEANYGVSLIDSSTIHAGAGNLTVSGTSQAKGVFIESFSGGMTYSGANVAITGTTSAGSGYPAVYIDNETLSATNSLNITANNGDLVVYGGTISTSGSGGLTLRATGGSPLPARIDIDSSSFVGNVGGGTSEVKLIADRLELGGAISSGAGARTVIHSNSTNRAVSLGGTDEDGTLNLTSAELDQIYASALVIGWNDQAGGISIDGAVAPSQLTTLSLINNQLSGPGISQVAPLTIANLNVDARTVSLSDNTNQISLVSGRYYAGSLDVRSSTGMSVGTVDGVGGIVGSTTGSLFVQAGGLLVVDRQCVRFVGVGDADRRQHCPSERHHHSGQRCDAGCLGYGHVEVWSRARWTRRRSPCATQAAVLFGNMSASTGLTVNNISGDCGPASRHVGGCGHAERRLCVWGVGIGRNCQPVCQPRHLVVAVGWTRSGRQYGGAEHCRFSQRRRPHQLAHGGRHQSVGLHQQFCRR